MKRRNLLKLGFGGAVVLAVAGTGMSLIRPGFKNGRMSEATRAWMGAVALALLDGALAGARPRARPRAAGASGGHGPDHGRLHGARCARNSRSSSAC